MKQINIEKIGDSNYYPDAINTSNWESLEAWLLRNNETIEEIKKETIPNNIPVNIKNSSRLWQEIQAYLYLFSSSISYLIKFKSRTRPLISLLAPILRDLPNFNTDPRYVENETALENILNIANSLVNTDRIGFKLKQRVDKLWETNQSPIIKVDEDQREDLENILGNLSDDYVGENSRINLVSLLMLADELNNKV